MKRRRRPARPRLGHYIEFFFLALLMIVVRIVPRRAYGVIARGLALYWYYIFPLRKDVVLENLGIAFPDKGLAWRKRVAKRCMEHFAAMGLEFAEMHRRGPEAIREMMSDIEGLEHYEAAGGNRSSYVFVTGHLGNWELAISYFAAFKGLNMAVLAKPLHNPLIERRVANARKERKYEVIYTRGDDLRSIIRIARQGRPLGFVADQDARRTGLFVDFFGRPASTFQGPAVFAHRLGIPLLFGTCCRTAPRGPFRMRFAPPILPDPKADREQEVARLTRAHVALLEQAIREHPEQYFWFHKRWKTRPRRGNSGRGAADFG